MAEYEKYVVRAKNKSQAFKKLRIMLKEKGLTLQPYAGRRAFRLKAYLYRIYYKSRPRIR